MILTGNAGDGKTTLASEVFRRVMGSSVPSGSARDPQGEPDDYQGHERAGRGTARGYPSGGDEGA